ncbi:hypothetical protein [Marinicella marina]|uniref:hypothetical protein n=1 Tax=Marinicella marina TaxID=2996016 RepID=UPI002260FFB2|nr:hypothetical protein [Marinicella marina]
MLYALVIAALVLAWVAQFDYKQPKVLTVIYLKSQALKYLPGNFFHFAYRHKATVDLGQSHKQVMKATVMESAGLIFAALLMAHLSLFQSSNNLLWLNKLDIPIVLLLVFDALVLISVIRWMKWRFFYAQLVWFIAYFIGMGIIIIIMIIAWGFSPQAFLSMTTCYALAWLAGYLLPGAPGGIGVREAVFIAVSKPTLEESEALILIAGIRLISLSYEAIAYFFAARISHLLFRQSENTK